MAERSKNIKSGWLTWIANRAHEQAYEDAKAVKSAHFRTLFEKRVASVQRSFEKARRGKDLFGLDHAEQ